MRGKWSAVPSVVVVVDGHGRRDDQQLAKLFPRRNANGRRFGHRRARRRADSRETGRGTGVHRGQVAAAARRNAPDCRCSSVVAQTADATAAASRDRCRKNVVVLTDVGDCGDCPSSRWFLRAGAVVRLDDLVRDQILGVGLQGFRDT